MPKQPKEAKKELKGGVGGTAPKKVPAKKVAAPKAEAPAQPTSPMTQAATKKVPAKKVVRDLSTPEVKAAEAPPKPKAPTVIPMPKKEAREVVYPDPKVEMYRGKNALGIDRAKTLLRWEEEPSGSTFKEEYHFTDLHNRKIRIHNNRANRPFDLALAKRYAHEVLQRHWRLNGETLIIGKTGETISAQHRLVAAVLAHQEWERHPDEWKHLWPTPPTMDCIVVFGIEEGDDTVNTIDTGRPRTLADVLYRTSDVFKGITKESERKQVTRLAAYGVKAVWQRTGAGGGVFAAQPTHADFMDFIERHPRLLQNVVDVWSEDAGKDKRISRYIPLGQAAGLLYLMGCSAADGKEYREADRPNEDMLDWSLEDKAWDFFAGLAGGDQLFSEVRDALQRIVSPQEGEEEDTTGLATMPEKVAVIVKAWNLYANGEAFSKEGLRLEYNTDDHGVKRLAECPTVGGIDRGTEKEPEAAPTPEQLEEKKRQNVAKAKSEAGKGLKPSDLTEGQQVVVSQEGEEWTGTLVRCFSNQTGSMAEVRDDKGDSYDIPLKQISV